MNAIPDTLVNKADSKFQLLCYTQVSIYLQELEILEILKL